MFVCSTHRNILDQNSRIEIYSLIEHNSIHASTRSKIDKKNRLKFSTITDCVEK